MPVAAEAAVAADGQAEEGQQRRGGGLLGMVVRGVMMWYLFKTFFGGKSTPPQQTPSPVATTGDPGSAVPLGPATITPLFPRDASVDVAVYLSDLEDWRIAEAAEEPAWRAWGIPLTGGEGIGAVVEYAPSESVRRNGSAYVHAVFRASGETEGEHAEGAGGSTSGDAGTARRAFARTSLLTAYRLAPRDEEGMHLLGGGKEEEVGEGPQGESAAPHTNRPVLNYVKPNVTISLVDEFHEFPARSIPPQYRETIVVDVAAMSYEPIVWFNEFWLLRDGLVEVNETSPPVAVRVDLQNVAAWKYTIYTQLEQSFSMQKNWGAMADGETDDLKRIFLEGNPVFLGITMLVSLLHSLFDALAFKNDIGFWKQNKSMRGLSARSIVVNAFCQLVITLYLLDNETSFVVMASSVVGTAIEFWKVTKAMNVTIERREDRLARRAREGEATRRAVKRASEADSSASAGGEAVASGVSRSWQAFLDSLPFTLRLADRESYGESDTDRYDAEAMRYLSYALYPLVGGYAVYSLWYKTHRSWYSWVLDSLVGAVYTFGFILMCPQLYLNYRLKSVAHLPWRQMSYKFLNTIIDDLFAFVIKMPWLHRLSVFRDDLVFCVYLYQRWAYRVDKTRANEFGYVEEPTEELAGEIEGSADASVTGGTPPANPTLSTASQAAERKKDR